MKHISVRTVIALIAFITDTDSFKANSMTRTLIQTGWYIAADSCPSIVTFTFVISTLAVGTLNITFFMLTLRSESSFIANYGVVFFHHTIIRVNEPLHANGSSLNVVAPSLQTLA